VKLFLFNVVVLVVFIWCIKIHSHLNERKNQSILDGKAGGFIVFLYFFVLWPVTLASGGYVISLFLGLPGNRY
jgi:hypothetical protein